MKVFSNSVKIKTAWNQYKMNKTLNPNIERCLVATGKTIQCLVNTVHICSNKSFFANDSDGSDCTLPFQSFVLLFCTFLSSHMKKKLFHLCLSKLNGYHQWCAVIVLWSCEWCWLDQNNSLLLMRFRLIKYFYFFIRFIHTLFWRRFLFCIFSVYK